jgi:hypothetical protein
MKNNSDWTTDGFFKVSNHGTASFKKLSYTGLLDSILSQDLSDDLLKEFKQNGRSDRGSAQRYAGYATLNQKFDADHCATAPQRIGSRTKLYTKKMVQFTALIKEFCSQFGLKAPYSDDPVCNADWAQRLCDKLGVNGVNIIEQCTFALTCLDTDDGSEPTLFGAHVDHLIDPQWSEVFCVYKHFYQEGRLYRLAAIAYSCSIIRKFRFKEITYGCLREKIISYLGSATNSRRINITLDACVPLDLAMYSVEDGIHYRKTVPFLDKAGFYSGFADTILKVWDVRSIQRACELLILVGWIPTATTYQKILSEWTRSGRTPDGIWTLSYIDHSLQLYGGLTNGPGHRCKPWMHSPLLLRAIINGLQTLRTTLIMCIKDFASPGAKKMSYVHVHKRISEIGGVGVLGVQHIIGVSSLLNRLAREGWGRWGGWR